MAILTQENAMSGYTAKQAEEDTLGMIKVWVWSGFRSESEAADMLEDHLSEEDALTDPDAIRKALAAEFKTKAAAEKSWPKETDCDRLDRAFDALMAAGICALHNAGYTQSDGHADVAQELQDQGRAKFHGYCFYHGQDVERAVHGDGLLIAFGDLDDDQARSEAVGREVCAALNAAGFATVWDGTHKTRIDIPKIVWRRRSPQ